MAAPARVFSGIQPTGTIHLGNYVGAIRNWVRLQEQYESYFCIVDFHAITIPYEAKEMPIRVLEAATDILASGVDPERCIFFAQSWVPEHTELAWIFNSLASIGALERMTQFKEKSEQFRDNVNAGLFTYPVLQAADILLYKASVVPVGEDQLQHLELTREIARRFNHHYGDTFPEAKADLTPTARLMALNDPARKMSKSLPGSFINLSDSDAEIRKKISRAVTDSGPTEAGEMSPGVKNLFALLRTFAPEKVQYFQEQYDAGTLRYGELKPAVAEAVVADLGPVRARREELLAHPDQVWDVLDDGARRARAVAKETLVEVRRKMGLRGGRE
jgi:tryptophanyl-tRNA synthetase